MLVAAGFLAGIAPTEAWAGVTSPSAPPAATSTAAPPDTSNTWTTHVSNVAYTLDRTSADVGGAVATSGSFTAGLSARFGHSFGPLYFGVLGDFWFPGGQDVVASGAQVSASATALDVLGMFGYDFAARWNLVVRPIAGVGFLYERATACAGDPGSIVEHCARGTYSSVAFGVATQALFYVRPIEIGLEIRGLFGTDGGTGLLGAHVGTVF
jgi:hypothetical protein